MIDLDDLIPATSPQDKFGTHPSGVAWAPAQIAIFEAIVRRVDNVLINAVAGSGKTTTIGIVTALNPYIGYANATAVAQEAHATGGSDANLVIAALLHDCVEDQGVTRAEVAEPAPREVSVTDGDIDVRGTIDDDDVLDHHADRRGNRTPGCCSSKYADRLRWCGDADRR